MTDKITNESETRFQAIHERIGPEITGLRASIYLHVEYDEKKRIVGIRLSEKRKDGFGLDPVFHAIGDRLSAIAEELNRASGVKIQSETNQS